jgi:hypothetical protein
MSDEILRAILVARTVLELTDMNRIAARPISRGRIHGQLKGKRLGSVGARERVGG